MANTEYPILPLRNMVIFPDQVVPLQVGRPKSVSLIEGAMHIDNKLVVISQRDESVDDPTQSDLYEVGTLVSIIKLLTQDDGTYTVIVQGIKRLRMESLHEDGEYFTGTFSEVVEKRSKDANELALMRSLKDTASEMVTKADIPQESIHIITSHTDPSKITDFILAHASLPVKDKQVFLEEMDINTRLENCIKLMVGQMDIAQVGEAIMTRVREETDKTQKEYYLRQQLKAIQEQLGQTDDDLNDLESRIANAKMPELAHKAAMKQYHRLQNMQQSSSEYSVATSYIEFLLEVPWNALSEDNLDLMRAQGILDDDHYGLFKVKDRIVQYLAVLSLKSDMKGPILCFHGPPGVGKAQPLYSKVLTPDGWTTMGKVQPGSLVIGADGKAHTVKEVFPQGEKDIYRIHFQDGSYTDSCKEHLWLTQTDLDRKANRPGTVKTLEFIMETLRYSKDQRKNHSIPMTTPVEFPEKALPLDPYVLGTLLGDGTLRKNGTAAFSNPEKDICSRVASNLPPDIQMLKQVGDNVDYRLTTGSRPKADEKGHLSKNSLQKILIDLELAGCRSDEKFVPYVYLHGSVKQRIDLLHGLMDTDGTVDRTGCRVEFSSTSKRLAQDVQFLVQSLGGTTPILRTKKGWYKDEKSNRIEGKLCYRVTVSMPPGICPFWCSIKATRHTPKTKYAPKRFIDRVEYVGKVEAKCILIDSEDHLYLTDNFIVTHNTSLAKSISRSMGRKFARIALGGVHDESEIRGHRRTYVGALPGRIAQAVIKAGTMNPVILLDEIDKVGRDFRGDPSAALLEVLDPEQNHTFSDHYLEIELDLSKVIFIATANQLDTISPPLRDRMEIIDVPSYTLYEKQQIAQKYLIPKQIEDHGITTEHMQVPEDIVRHVIDKYTREAGVRNLERRVAALCRNVAVEVAKKPVEDRGDIHIIVGEEFVEKALGPERYVSEVAQRANMVGVSTGLAWTQSGGDILFIEAQEMPGKGDVKLTGQLGDVMKESVHAALSYIRANSVALGVDANLAEAKRDLHIHVPAGAIPKDGPSAGITMFTAMYSRLKGQKVRKDLAMTGEITLSGNVLPVGGIKEKMIAAHRAGIKTIIMPALCKKDLVDVDDAIKNDLVFHFVTNVEEILPLIFE